MAMDRKRDCRKWQRYRYSIYWGWKIEYTHGEQFITSRFFWVTFYTRCCWIISKWSKLIWSQFLAENADKVDDSYSGQWIDVNITEMKTFTGLIFLMEVVYKPSIPSYWWTDELFHTPIF